MQRAELRHKLTSISKVEVMAATANARLRNPIVLTLVGSCGVDDGVGFQCGKRSGEISSRLVEHRRLCIAELSSQARRGIGIPARYDEFRIRLAQQSSTDASAKMSGGTNYDNPMHRHLKAIG